ncbi:hypothetical protein CEXT_144001 [Caerostris extrusa]|uniref:Uncharacterized protein n=1 Tax=Caerostris extrusa TaxID=172846 RepID=A0AAV4NU10_CAEEX|nr:hypothetical protein CEXT_144001 [Caerostris extrusa]
MTAGCRISRITIPLTSNLENLQSWNISSLWWNTEAVNYANGTESASSSASIREMLQYNNSQQTSTLLEALKTFRDYL